MSKRKKNSMANLGSNDLVHSSVYALLSEIGKYDAGYESPICPNSSIAANLSRTANLGSCSNTKIAIRPFGKATSKTKSPGLVANFFD